MIIRKYLCLRPGCSQWSNLLQLSVHHGWDSDGLSWPWNCRYNFVLMWIWENVCHFHQFPKVACGQKKYKIHWSKGFLDWDSEVASWWKTFLHPYFPPILQRQLWAWGCPCIWSFFDIISRQRMEALMGWLEAAKSDDGREECNIHLSEGEKGVPFTQ